MPPRGRRGGGMGGARGGAGRRRGARRGMRRRRRRRMLLVGGLVAFGAYKMSTKDADRIKQDTGVDPEEMTDEELEASMAKLGIEKQYRDAEDVEVAGSTSTTDMTAELEKLAELRDKGILSEEEFTAKKQQILNL